LQGAICPLLIMATCAHVDLVGIFDRQPGSTGGFVSYGCIRMYNADISDLFARVGYGTTVVVTQ
jgi:L,D-transpeptidase catalytic domain